MTDNEGTWEPVEHTELRIGDTWRKTGTRWPNPSPVTYERLIPPPRTFEPGDVATARALDGNRGPLLVRTHAGRWLDTRTGGFHYDSELQDIHLLVVLDEKRIPELVGYVMDNAGSGSWADVIRAYVEQEKIR